MVILCSESSGCLACVALTVAREIGVTHYPLGECVFLVAVREYLCGSKSKKPDMMGTSFRAGKHPTGNKTMR
jgi:hypothetical protein